MQLYQYLMGGQCKFIGESPGQITRTLDRLVEMFGADQWAKPDEKDIMPIGSFEASLQNPYALENSYIDAQVTPEVKLHVNANALYYIKEIARAKNLPKYGELYVLGDPIHSLYFFPMSVMEGIRNYDWSQHDAVETASDDRLQARLGKIDEHETLKVDRKIH